MDPSTSKRAALLFDTHQNKPSIMPLQAKALYGSPGTRRRDTRLETHRGSDPRIKMLGVVSNSNARSPKVKGPNSKRAEVRLGDSKIAMLM